MEHYSHTRLELFEACPGAYYDKFEAKLPEPPSEPMGIGRLVHEIILEYNKHCLQKGVESDVTAMPAIARKKYHENPVPLHPSRFGEILRLAENYATGHLIDPHTKVGFEEKILLYRPMEAGEWVSLDPTVPDTDKSFWCTAGDAFWIVIDDLAIAGDTAVITDYKTSWEIASQNTVDTNPQLDRYAFGVAMEYPQIQYFKVKLDFVRWKVVRERQNVITRGQALAVKDDINARILQIKDARKKKKWPRWPGYHCGYCPRVVNCTEARKFDGTVIIDTPEKAEKAFEDLILLDGYNKARKEALKGFCQGAGTIVKNGMEIGYRKVESREIPVEHWDEVAALLAEYNENIWDYVKFSMTDMKHLFERPGLGERLLALARDKSYTQFKITKVKGEDD